MQTWSHTIELQSSTHNYFSDVNIPWGLHRNLKVAKTPKPFNIHDRPRTLWQRKRSKPVAQQIAANGGENLQTKQLSQSFSRQLFLLGTKCFLLWAHAGMSCRVQLLYSDPKAPPCPSPWPFFPYASCDVTDTYLCRVLHVQESCRRWDLEVFVLPFFYSCLSLDTVALSGNLF